jgi:chromosome segregation ATPase
MRAMKRTLDYLPAPLLVGLLALGLFWLVARWDGAQTARLAELDRQHAAATRQALAVARDRRRVVEASAETDRRVARLAARQRLVQDSLRQAEARAAALADTVARVLAALPAEVSQPVRDLLAEQDAQIRHLGQLLADERTKSGELLKDRDRWQAQAANEASMAATWKRRAEDWQEEARRGCLPLVGCVGRTAAFGIGAALGATAALALR